MSQWKEFDILKKEWMKDKEFASEYRALELEYKIALILIKARSKAGLTQADIAKRMGTTQSVIARLESGTALPSVKTLNKYAQATGQHLELRLT